MKKEVNDVADIKKYNSPVTSKSNCLICKNCGRKFIYSQNEYMNIINNDWKLPIYCVECKKVFKKQKNQELEQRKSQKRKQEKEIENIIFRERLTEWNVIAKEDIAVDNDNVLYILGNGFDLIHCVKSSYYSFRDWLGKNNTLRNTLEDFIILDDLWSDFEEALAYFNIEVMSNKYMVNNYLDIFDVHNKDSNVADIFLAAEAAANPILEVCFELPHQFRKWIESLTIGTEDRPFRTMFRNGKVLCFNYTEFVEIMYGVSENNICYIHGCRRKNKYQPKDQLILGHRLGASDSSYEYKDVSLQIVRNSYKQYLLETTQEQVFHLIMECDQSLTKDCGKIISDHEAFFESLKDIQNIIVIGHSLSPVDWDYFREVKSKISNSRRVHWYFGCYGLRDLENLKALLAELNIIYSDVTVFQTNDILVTPSKKIGVVKPSLKEKAYNKLSIDGKWRAHIKGCSLKILNEYNGKTDYEVVLFSKINDVFFSYSGDYLFVIIRGAVSSILYFHLKDNHWSFISELSSNHQSNLINARLKHVFLTNLTITFVYNNRVKKYDLKEGILISNLSRKGASSKSYEGEDVIKYFLRSSHSNR